MESDELKNQMEQLRDRLLKSQHESILRDLELTASVKRHQEELVDLTGKMVVLATGLNALIDRMDKTDRRWNELIDILGKEHHNGHTKPPTGEVSR